MYYKVIQPPTNIDDHTFSRLLADISGQRREKVLRYKHQRGRIESLYSYIILKELLNKNYGIVGNPIFREGEHGKPVITSIEDNGTLHSLNGVHFNISHSNTGIACVVDDQPIGIDIESIHRKVSNSLIRYVLNETEIQHVQASEQPDIEFVKLWTMKESLVKLIGTGISDSNQLKSLLTDSSSYSFLTTVNEEQGWVLTICKFRECPDT